jgi:LysM repeat protein
MKTKALRLAMLAALVLAALAGARAAAPAIAAPPAQANLLSNPSLDSFSGGVATGWEPWWQTIANPGDGSLNYAVQPDFVPETNPTFVLAGSGSQHIGRNWDPFHAGIRQTFNVPAGSTVRITASGRVRASGDAYPAPSDSGVQARLQVGAEPNGSIDWAASTVKWSAQGNPHDAWGSLTVDVTAGTAGKVTVFLSADFRGDSRLHLDVWWDNVSAQVVSGAPANTQPPANTQAPGATSPPQATSSGGNTQPTSAPPPSNFQTATPGADGNIIYVVQEGDALWSIAARHGVTVDQIRSLNGLTSDIISIGQRLIIAQGAPSASETPTTDPNAPTADPNATATADPNLPPPTLTPAATEIAQATEEAEVGTVCALLYNDENGNGVRDASESLLPGGQLSVVEIATGTPVQAYTTDGLNEPHCFEDLPAAQYTISSAAPAGYNPTTVTSTPLDVTAGSTSALEFGAQPSAAVIDQPPAENGDSNQALLTALLFAGGVVFLLLAAGVGGLLMLRRPRK